MSAATAPPPGYTRLKRAHMEVVARTSMAAAVEQALSAGTLYAYAQHHPRTRMLVGRGIVYAVPLPDDAGNVVVRHSRHGGVLAPVTGDRFLGHGRAPYELEVALHLERAGIPTPEIVAYAAYPAGGPFRSTDIVTREVPDARDLAGALADAPPPHRKRALLAATATLMAQLALAGVRHPDLNLRNILVAPDENGALEAQVLDVDRVWFDAPGAPAVRSANQRRFNRSARKLRRREGLAIEDADLLWIAATVRERTEDGV
ncbi:MAG TPA: lipopolysaccharide kinase InaA family protein [Gemmatimonadaceae bacterium]|nr:lipopolysaccharide kinase InaA family protein [Gemmatimonadaceae bacterium]